MFVQLVTVGLFSSEEKMFVFTLPLSPQKNRNHMINMLRFSEISSPVLKLLTLAISTLKLEPLQSASHVPPNLIYLAPGHTSFSPLKKLVMPLWKFRAPLMNVRSNGFFRKPL